MYTLRSFNSNNTVIKTSFSNLAEAQEKKAQLIALAEEAGVAHSISLVDESGVEL